MERGEHEKPSPEAAPVGRVLLEPEELRWEDARVVATASGKRWSPPLILLALVLILVMVAVLLLVLWGVFQTAPA